MTDAIFHSPAAINETVQSYAPGTKEREQVLAEYDRMMKQKRELPMWIGGKAVETKDRRPARPPHQHKHILGYSHHGDKGHVKAAIDAALKAKQGVGEHALGGPRSDLPEGRRPDQRTLPRHASMPPPCWRQSKNVYQAEIDAACEFADFLRFNVSFMQQIYRDQPVSAAGIWNRVEYRPLEGFVFALTPFNFTAIAGNLPASAALMGNTVVWKCADTPGLQRAGDHGDLPRRRSAGWRDQPHPCGAARSPATSSSPIRSSPACTSPAAPGCSARSGNRSATTSPIYRSYPRIVGETGGKDFVIAHPSADPLAGGHRTDPRRLRVPRAEVQRRQPGLHPGATSGRR